MALDLDGDDVTGEDLKTMKNTEISNVGVVGRVMREI